MKRGAGTGEKLGCGRAKRMSSRQEAGQFDNADEGARQVTMAPMVELKSKGVSMMDPTRTGEIVCKPSDELVAGVLLHLVRKSPGGQMSAASLCSTVYKQCAGAKCVIVDKYHGLKGFVSSSVLNRHVGFVPDEVC